MMYSRVRTVLRGFKIIIIIIIIIIIFITTITFQGIQESLKPQNSGFARTQEQHLQDGQELGNYCCAIIPSTKIWQLLEVRMEISTSWIRVVNNPKLCDLK